MQTQWSKTRHGGLRRTRVPQKYDEAKAESGPEDLRHTEAVVGSNPSPRTFIIKFKERLGLPTCPYLVRWRLETKWGSVRLHHWLGPDDSRNFHDHPWDFVTFVLKGGYTDSNPNGKQHLKAPAVQYRSAIHQHTVFPDSKGAWTLVFTGPKIRPWGFWVTGKFKKANKYFLSYGHHPCD